MLVTKNGFTNESAAYVINSLPTLETKQAVARENRAEREKVVQKAMESTCIPLACKYLNSYMYNLYGPSPQKLCNILGRIESLYNQIFPPTPGLNTSTVRRPTFLTDDNQIQQAFIKADKLYLAYQDAFIKEAVQEMPKFFIQELNLKPEDEDIIKQQFYPAVNAIREVSLDSEFSTFHREKALSFIHYFLHIPTEIPNSYTYWMFRDMQKVNLIEMDNSN